MISSQLRVVILTKIYYHDLGKNLPVVNLTKILAKIPVLKFYQDSCQDSCSKSCQDSSQDSRSNS